MKGQKRFSTFHEVPDLRQLSDDHLLRQGQVLAVLPFGKSVWHAGRRSGRFPPPDAYVGPRMPVWKVGTVKTLLAQLVQGQDPVEPNGVSGDHPQDALDQLLVELRAGRLSPQEYKVRRQALTDARVS